MDLGVQQARPAGPQQRLQALRGEAAAGRPRTPVLPPPRMCIGAHNSGSSLAGLEGGGRLADALPHVASPL
jgi:hypothetical protein